VLRTRATAKDPNADDRVQTQAEGRTSSLNKKTAHGQVSRTSSDAPAIHVDSGVDCPVCNIRANVWSATTIMTQW